MKALLSTLVRYARRLEADSWFLSVVRGQTVNERPGDDDIVIMGEH